MSSPGKELGAAPAALIAGALFACHLALCAYFAPRAELQSGRLVLHEGFAIEAYRAFRALAAFDKARVLSAYDPSVLGGQPAGLVELFGTRVFVSSVVLSSRLGLNPVRAFNATIVAMHAGLPLVGYAAARAFRLGRGTALVTTGFWVALWFFDSLVHYTWFSGRIAWALSCGLAMLLVAIGSRVAGGRDAKWTIGVIAVGFVALFVHPIPALAGAGILIGIALGRRGLLPWRRALLAGSALTVPLALAAAGPHTAALSSEPIQPVFRVGASQVLWDLVELSSSGYGAPGATRAMIRVFVLIAAVLGLARLRAAGDYRYAPLAIAAGAGTAVAYLGAYLPVRWPIDPYFFAVFGALAASIPAAWLLVDLEWPRILRSAGSRLLVIVVVVVAIPRFARTVATFVPELLPERVVRSTIDVMVSPLVGIKEPLPDRLRHEAHPPGFAVVAEWFAEHYGGRGAVLCDDAELMAYLSATGTLPLVGPLGERGARSSAADATRLFSEPTSSERVEAFLDQHAVGWVALWGAPSRFDLDDPLLDPVVRVAGVRIRRVKREPSFFADGVGAIRSMALGRLRVTTLPSDASPAPRPSRVTLRFHYDPSLECRPNCRIRPVPYESAYGSGDWISIEHPPPEFELVSPFGR